jgi:nucleotide-binding universal stress UspA family protein
MSEQRGIVVGYDGSEASGAAVRWAAVEARLRGVPLTVVHAWEVYVGAPAPMALPVADLKAAAERVLEEGVEHARKEAPDVRGVLGRGGSATALIDAAREADLVVVGTRGHGGFAELVLGSTAATVASHARCPAVVVRDEPDPDGPVVVGVDGSPASLAALAAGFAEAELRGAEVLAVLAWPDVVEADPAPLVDAGDLRGLAAQRLDDLVEPLQARHPGVPVRTEVVTGRPREVLLGAAADASLLIVGTRGHGGIRGMLLGSVSHAVLHHATCPVAVVHAAPTA